MRKLSVLTIIISVLTIFIYSFKYKSNSDNYRANYVAMIDELDQSQKNLLNVVAHADIQSADGIKKIKVEIAKTREVLKGVDFWLRYLEPVAYKKVNGPLPVEWETEVFEKFEAPYRREGAGITLAELYIEEPGAERDSLLHLVQSSINALTTYHADSIKSNLQTYHHFFLCNRLFLLNLASVYTTGFECPDTSRIIPELQQMLESTTRIYHAYNSTFENTPLTEEYLTLYKRTIEFVRAQPTNYSNFDHFSFIKNYINPLFKLNQYFIRTYKVSSHSYVDYTLSKTVNSIFDKDLYRGQNSKGIFLRVTDESTLKEIERIGKLLYYDPILSGNNLRSCNSCHSSTQYFTDTTFATSLNFNAKDHLPRNSPSLINARFNHLLMLDGKHTALQNQLKDVITSKAEMGSEEKDVIKKVMSVPEYKRAFTRLLQYTPQEPTISLEHIASAITFYYGKFSNYYSPFDDAVNDDMIPDSQMQHGFNLFMGKAQCATCHFVPHFNGVKPPFVSSEFEVLGVPSTKSYTSISNDEGRYKINRAKEMMNATRTGSVRNVAFTGLYMHNGVFTSLEEVIDFYDGGGGAGHKLKVNNQTLSSDSLHLSVSDKKSLIYFIRSLSEKILFENAPAKLPPSSFTKLNKRKVGGTY
jgi:cytochrome c peroxidase